MKNEINEEILKEFKKLSEENVHDCYQCGKCSAGCPSAANMSILPHMVIRRLQRNQPVEAIIEDAIWKCTSCMTCWSRCPKKVNLCRIMETLRFIYMTKYNDKYPISEIPKELLEEAPQQLIISGMRKFTY